MLICVTAKCRGLLSQNFKEFPGKVYGFLIAGHIITWNNLCSVILKKNQPFNRYVGQPIDGSSYYGHSEKYDTNISESSWGRGEIRRVCMKLCVCVPMYIITVCASVYLCMFVHECWECFIYHCTHSLLWIRSRFQIL